MASGFGFFRKAIKESDELASRDMMDAYIGAHPNLVESLRGSLTNTATVANGSDGLTLEERLASIERTTIMAWDFDGTIADTEKLHVAAYNVILYPHRVELSAADFERYRGKTEFAIYAEIERDFGVALPGEIARSSRLDVFHQLAELTGIKPFSYVIPTLDAARLAGAPSVVVSSQLAQVVSRYLRSWSLADRFAALLTPDLFGPSKLELLASLPSRFGGTPSNYVVLEDSIHVLEAMQRLGMVGHYVHS
jgi:beta-phosphoglucomutase-like phosphatase (HAD superfamily)